MGTQIHFAEPSWFFLLILLLPMLLSYRRKKATLRVPTVRGLAGVARSRRNSLRHVGFICRALALVLFTCALARPQSGRSQAKQRSEGLDMMLVIDTSRSMTAMDFIINGQRQDRVHIVKKLIGEFIRNRTDDRLGLTIFGTNAFAYVPLTLDHDVLLRYLDEVEVGMAGDSTAIGDAIGVATNRLKNVKTKNKVIILLTDGANQTGKVDPMEAARAAKTLGVRVYTIGIGTNDLVPVPTPLGMRKARFEIDEELLENIAKTTDARYFKASDTETLQRVYKTIDALEKTEVEQKVFKQYDEKYAVFIWPAFALLLIELLFRMTRYRRLP